MTGAEQRLLDVPRMTRDLQRARAENARFRAFLKQLNVSAADIAAVASDSAHQQSNNDEEGEVAKPSSASLRSPQLDDDREDDEDDEFVSVSRSQRRRQHADGASKALELTQAEERVAYLEAQLLDAEETICHLKAERMAALRDAERFRLALAEAQRSLRQSIGSEEEAESDRETDMRRLVLELESRLSDAEKDRETEQEQHMAVIREQEGELRALTRELEAKDQELASLRDKYLDAVQEIQFSSDMDKLDTSAAKVDSASKVDVQVQGDGMDDDSLDIPAFDMDWREELVRHPTPHFDLDSPEVQYLLHTWTGNVKKLQYLRLWFTRVVSTRGSLPEDFPLGIELPRLTPEVRDGFLALVVPLLRRQTEREVLVHSRKYNDPLHSDLRIRVVPRR